MRVTLKTAGIIALASLSFSATAGQFHCQGYGELVCAEHIERIVTDKFMAYFPITKYQIVAVYGFQPHSDGGGAGFASVGVSPIVSGKSKYGELSLMPSRRYTSTMKVLRGHIDPYQKTRYEIKLLQVAVQTMMEDCDRQAACKILEMK